MNSYDNNNKQKRKSAQKFCLFGSDQDSAEILAETKLKLLPQLRVQGHS